jgi:hypothetical protein
MVFFRSIQKRKSMNWMDEIKRKKMPVAIFSARYLGLPRYMRRIENTTPRVNVKRDTFSLKHI